MKCDPFGPGHYELSRDEQLLSIGIIEALRDAVGPDVESSLKDTAASAPTKPSALQRSWSAST